MTIQSVQKATDIRGGNTNESKDTTTWTSRVRNTLFPIHGEEIKKFLLIGSIKFFVIMALTLTRDNKDTMVVTECGAEAIAFLKVSTSVWML
jgi:AAA family ATP:ADP antiporter